MGPWKPNREFSRNPWSKFRGSGQSREGSRFMWSNFRGAGHQRPRPLIQQREQSHRAHRSHSSVATAGSSYSGTNTSARYLEASILRIPGLHLASTKTRNVREFRTHGHPNAVAQCRPSLLPRPSPASLDGIVTARHRSIPGLFQSNQMSAIKEGPSALTLDDTLVVISTDQFLPRRCQPPSGCGGRSEYHGGAHVGHPIPHTLRSVHVIG